MKNNILDKGCNDCTGCSACAITCTQSAIKMITNANGFYTPVLDENFCTSCGLCKSVCYKYLDDTRITPQASFLGKKVISVLNNYFEQMHTVSTAGVATQLAKYYFNQEYNVCGVAFDPKTDKCEHIIVQNENDITKLKGSKYLQSSCVDAFLDIFHDSKKSLIFGTPCQIYGLRQLMIQKKIEDKFILVDLFCAGVPSLNLWVRYKDFLCRIFKLANIQDVNFRDKNQGWHKYSIKITDENKVEYRQNLLYDLFFSFFLKKTCFSKACYSCKLRHDATYSDIRLGDFWG
jgi:coenzyme F420-reducing hydrogenase beta subunit